MGFEPIGPLDLESDALPIDPPRSQFKRMILYRPALQMRARHGTSNQAKKKTAGRIRYKTSTKHLGHSLERLRV